MPRHAIAQGEFLISGSLDTLTDRIQVMDAAHDEAGIELLPNAHMAHANHATLCGQMDEAIHHYTTAVDLALATGDRRRAILWSGLFAQFLANRGFNEPAIERAEQSRALAAEAGRRSLLAEGALGIALSDVDPEKAIRHLESTWELADDEGNEVQMLTSGTWLANLLAASGDINDALNYSLILLDNAIATGNPMLATPACDSLAIMLTRTDYSDVAGVLFGALGALEQWPTPPGPMLDRHLDAIETLHARMEPERLQQCLAQGRSMTVDEMLAFARAAVTQIAVEIGSGH